MIPLDLDALSFSITKAAPPIPSNIPFLLASKGKLTSSTIFPIECAPAPAKPAPIHSNNTSLVVSSALTTITLDALPVVIQSSAIENAAGVDAQALFIAVLGPLAPIHCANWLCPIDKICNKNLLSKVPFSSAPLFAACFNNSS